MAFRFEWLSGTSFAFPVVAEVKSKIAASIAMRRCSGRVPHLGETVKIPAGASGIEHKSKTGTPTARAAAVAAESIPNGAKRAAGLKEDSLPIRLSLNASFSSSFRSARTVNLSVSKASVECSKS